MYLVSARRSIRWLTRLDSCFEGVFVMFFFKIYIYKIYLFIIIIFF